MKATLAQKAIAKTSEANPNEEEAPLDDNLRHLEDTIHLLQHEKYLDKSLLQGDYFLINKDADTIDENDNSRNEDEASCHICGPSRILKKSSLANHLKTFHKEKM